MRALYKAEETRLKEVKSKRAVTKADLVAEISSYKKLHKKLWKELQSGHTGAHSCCEVAEMMSDFEDKFPI